MGGTTDGPTNAAVGRAAGETFFSRRAAMAAGGLVGAGSLLAAVAPARGQGGQEGTPVATPAGGDIGGLGPLIYTLEGEADGRAYRLVFSEEASDGRPGLEVSVSEDGDEADPRTFLGDEVAIEQTALGRLVSVELEADPDRRTVRLGFLPPRVNLDPVAAETPVTALAIAVEVLASVAGPDGVDGAIESATAIPLSGTASTLFFPTGG